MKRLLALLVTTLSLTLPVGLTTELLSSYGSHALALTALSNLREQYPQRPQVARALTDDSQIAPSRIKDWESQALQSLSESLPVELPYSEQWLLSKPETQVITFDVTLMQGRILEIFNQRQPTAIGGIFIEIFERIGDRHRIVASASPADTQLRWPVTRTGTYRIRAQSIPESIGAFALSLEERFAFEFPVATDSPNSVQSFFGVARDGGRRKHHGIDIFAPRHTPIVAATDGYISRVSTSTRGGLHIWQRGNDDYGNPIGSLYYAHLEDTNVTAGAWVDRGTQIGTVGNSGNAISTPPHLHFGFYQRSIGPLDPLPFTGSARHTPAALSNGHRWPAWISVDRELVNVRKGPGTEHAIETTLSRGELVSLQAASKQWLRVRTGDGTVGFLAESLAQPPVKKLTPLTDSALVQVSLNPSSPVLIELAPGTVVEQLGRFGNARLVETDTGLQGWIIDSDEPASDETAS